MAPTGMMQTAASEKLSKLDDEQIVEFANGGNAYATEYLLKKYKGFVEAKARSYFLAGAEPDDVVTEGMIGLYKAIRDFRPDRLSHFRTFAELCVTRQIITAVKSAARNKHGVLNDSLSLQGSSLGDDGEGCLIDILADTNAHDPERICCDRLVVDLVSRHAVRDLSRLEKRVLRGYLQGRTYSQMSSNLGCPTKAVDNALQRAKRKVGRKLIELN